MTEADWQRGKVDDLRPYVETALELFGTRRLMFGSDWPVCLLAASYEQVIAAFDDCIAGLSAAERGDLYGMNAFQAYGLEING